MPDDPSLSPDIRVRPLLGLFRDGAWQIELAHDRAEHLLIWVTRGQGQLLLDGRRRGFGSHNALFIPAGSLMALQFGRNCLGQVLTVPVSNSAALPQHPHHLRLTRSDDQAQLTRLFDAMLTEQTQHPPLWHRAMQAYGELAGVQLRRQIQDHAPKQPRPTAAQRLSQAYCLRVADYHGENMTMTDHAAALNVTPTHLSRVCKSETGLTAAKLLSERQLYAARCLLIDSDLAMRDIARQLNFASAAYFTRFITQHTGQTPSALRKLALT